MTTSIRSADPKLTRVMTKSCNTSKIWSRNTRKTLYIHIHKAHDPKTWQGVESRWRAPHKVHVTLWSCSHVKIQEHHISSTSRPMAPKLSSLGRHVQSQMTLLFGGHPTKKLYLHFHKTYDPWHWLRMRELHLNIYN